MLSPYKIEGFLQFEPCKTSALKLSKYFFPFSGTTFGIGISVISSDGGSLYPGIFSLWREGTRVSSLWRIAEMARPFSYPWMHAPLRRDSVVLLNKRQRLSSLSLPLATWLTLVIGKHWCIVAFGRLVLLGTLWPPPCEWSGITCWMMTHVIQSSPLSLQTPH